MTLLHGTCLLNGKHKPGDPYAKECPVSPGRVAALAARSKKANVARWGRPGARRKEKSESNHTDRTGRENGPEAAR